MHLAPNLSDFRRWTKIVPTHGDLLFFRSRREANPLEGLGFHLLTPDDARRKAGALWSLDARSWYGYALSRARYFTWLPAGELDRLPDPRLRALARGQRKLNVPSIIPAARVPRRAPLPRVGNRAWVTAAGWRRTPPSLRHRLIAEWFHHCFMTGLYRSVDARELPANARAALRRGGMLKRLNRYLAHSGPNCFSAVAAVVSDSARAADEWMHWPDFVRHLRRARFRPHSGRKVEPRLGDVAVCLRRGKPVHAVYCLGGGLAFEKPGQDFHEPYRITRVKDFARDWPRCRIEIWRKK